MLKDDKGNEITNIPEHIAIIMDGNRRWAVERDLEYLDGHKEAIKRIEELIDYGAHVGVKYITLWAWSNKNWKRSKSFIDGIIRLFRYELGDEGLFARAAKKGARLRHIGNLKKFPQDIQKGVARRVSVEPDDPKIDVNLAVGYDGRQEIVDAVKKVMDSGVKAKDVTQELISRYLYTAGQPDVDLIIRTGGEKRTSGYLIWQIADAEFYFTETYMPDFGPDQLKEAIIDYSNRERRMGGDSEKY